MLVIRTVPSSEQRALSNGGRDVESLKGNVNLYQDQTSICLLCRVIFMELHFYHTGRHRRIKGIADVVIA